MMSPKKPICGSGIGLRASHYQTIIETTPKVPWFEILSDDYLIQGGPALQKLDKIASHYPFTLHGVSMSLGSTDPINFEYLKNVKQLSTRVSGAWISDHLCWSSHQKQYLPDLFPLPYTEEAINHVAARITQVQEYLGQQILIENVSTYLEYADSQLTEWAFLSAVAQKADCFILLDINNIYVSACNNGFDPVEYLKAVPKERVIEYHLAGFSDMGTHLLDTHSKPVHPPVWQLFDKAVEIIGPKPTLIEWDSDIPAFSVLMEQAALANQYLEKAHVVA